MFNLIIQHSPIGIAVIDLKGRCRIVNPAYAALYGYPHDALLGSNFLVVFAPHEWKRMQALHQQFLTEGTDLKGEWSVVRHDGVALHVMSESVRFPLDDGETGRLVYVLDKTHNHRAEVALRDSQERLAGIVESAMDAIISLDSQQRIVVFNVAAEKMFGYTAATMLGQPLDCLIPAGFRGQHHHHISGFAATGGSMRSMGALGQLSAVRANGEEFPIEASISQVRVAGEKVYTAIVRDISARIQIQKRLEDAYAEMARSHTHLEHFAHFDALTGLPNRLLLADRLHQSVAQCQRRSLSLAVLYIDLDGFKAINDLYGHAMGDALLVALAQRMKSALREGDTLARIGGDEFVAVLADLGHVAECEPMIARVLELAAQPLAVDGLVLQVSASIGFTVYPQDGHDADQLMRCADHAMYRAKQAGKNRHHRFDATDPTTQSAPLGAL